MSPGQRVYQSLRAAGVVDREWDELSPDEQANWDRGATLPPVAGTLATTQGADAKVK